METLVVYIRSKPQEEIDWGTNKVEFESGKKQYQQKWTKPNRTISFTTEGNKKYIDGIIDFFNARKGMFEKFKCDPFREGFERVYRFGSAKLSPQWYYDYKYRRVGATLDISLIEEKE